MLAGTFAMNAYNLTDTWFVAQLGTLPLAAIGFTFPVVMLLIFVAGGIGSGVTTLVSHAIGRRDRHSAAGLTTHGITFVVLTTAAISVVGYISINAVFTRLGADSQTLPLIGDYMRIWYLGALFMGLPMLGNGLLISAGDSRSASRVMILGTVINVVLDPILIFGYLGLPAMGIAGAALATVIARLITTIWLFHLLYRKHRLLLFKISRIGEYLISFRKILTFAVPSSLSMMLMPISAAVITRILSDFGNEAIAAIGVAGRIEMFAFVIPMALGMSMTPFVSQNYGANRLDRVREAKTLSTRFALLYGGATAVIFFICAPWFAAAFNSDPKVCKILVTYIRIISFGYGMMEVHRYCGFILTGIHRPGASMILNAIRVLVLLIPLSLLGAHLGGVEGTFIGRLVTDLTVGSIGLVWVSRSLKATLAPATDKPPN